MAIPMPLFYQDVAGIYSTRDMATQLPVAQRVQYLSWCDQLQAAMVVSEAERPGIPAADSSIKKKYPCLQCGKPSTLRCSACKNLPVSYTSDPDPAYYCNKDCSKSHWKVHKPICKRLVARKSLYRAGEVLQDIFYLRHEEGFAFEVTNLIQEGDNLHWYHPTNCPWDPLYHRVDSSRFGRDIARYRKLLATNSCGKTVTCWPQLVNRVVNGFIDHNMIFEVNIQYKGPGNQTWEHNTDTGSLTIDPTGSHEYWKVHLSDTEVYALDLTGAQFGWTETVLPWLEYEKRHVKEYRESCKYGNASQMLMDEKKRSLAGKSFDEHHLQRMTVEQGAMRCIETICHQPMPPERWSWDFDRILKLPEGIFEATKNDILFMIRFGVRFSLAGMNQTRKDTGDVPITLLAWPRSHVEWVPGKAIY